jgi:hypothetical protein
LTSVLDSTGYLHVFYEDANQQIQELYQVGVNSWAHNSPSSIAGAPLATTGSPLTSVLDSKSGFIHVFYMGPYMGTNFDVYQLYCHCSATAGDGAWDEADPSLLAGAPAAVTAGLTSLVDTTGSSSVIQVFYEYKTSQTANDVAQLYWTTAWHFADPGALAHASPALDYGPDTITSLIDTSSGSPILHVFYEAAGSNIGQLYWTTAWHYADPTTLGGCATTDAGSLTSFINTSGVGDTGIHLMYLGLNAHVYDLHWTTSWSCFDATATAGAPPATSAIALVGRQDINGGVRLYFIGTSSHVYELYWPSQEQASFTDLTAAAGVGRSASSGTLLTAVIVP